MAQKETAEQKLLKIIEASKKAQESAALSSSFPSPRRASGLFAINVHHVNFLLIVAVIASALYLGYELRNGMSLLQEDVSIAVDNSAPKQPFDLFVPRMKSVAYYMDKIADRNIFQPYEKKEVAVQAVTTAKADLEKKMSKYKFVGVAWLDVPESATVMLEDKASGITRFLKEGDKLEDVTVKTIYTDRVVVGYENEEIVIKL